MGTASPRGQVAEEPMDQAGGWGRAGQPCAGHSHILAERGPGHHGPRPFVQALGIPPAAESWVSSTRAKGEQHSGLV